MKRIGVVFPTLWDRAHAASGAFARAGFEVELARPDDEACPPDLDFDAWLCATVARWRGRVDGVTTSSDHPGPVAAAAVARELGLRGPDPAAVLRASHKLTARRITREAAPDATPRFERVDSRAPRAPSLGFPCFVKPVKGVFSRFARRVESHDELVAHVLRSAAHPFLEHYLALFHRLAARFGDAETRDASGFLAEELLEGEQVTLEGFVANGEVAVLGIVDSLFHPGVASFARFEHPSVLDAATRARCAGICARAVRAIGLDWTVFNVELTVDRARDRVSIVEVNPRMCGQFSDLYEKVDGASGHAAAFALACGERPRLARARGPFRFAASVPLRAFEAVRVARAPDSADLAAAAQLYPQTCAWSEVHDGEDLAPLFAIEDGASVRYGVVNVGADARGDLARRAEAVRRRLGYVMARPLHS